MKKILALILAMALIFCLAAAPAFAEGVAPATTPIDFAVNYGVVIFAGLCALAVFIVAIVTFTRLPKAEQIRKLKEWLLWAVIEAERIFGTETGEMKLRYVYNLFAVTFPWMERIITFEQFKELVDEALERMEELLQKNSKIKEYIEGAEKNDAPAQVMGFASDK